MFYINNVNLTRRGLGLPVFEELIDGGGKYLYLTKKIARAEESGYVRHLSNKKRIHFHIYVC
jgi:hypothetical protein